MTIKFMQRYETLVEPMAKNREFELLLTYHMKHDKVTIKKKKEWSSWKNPYLYRKLRVKMTALLLSNECKIIDDE